MTKETDQIDVLVSKVKALPADRQRDVIEALRELTVEPYQLSPAELAVLEPALRDAKNGIDLTNAADDELLTGPWA